MHNNMLNNPAYAGSNDGWEIHMAGRTQWVGIEGAPKSFSLGASGPINETSSLGAYLQGDQVGPFFTTEIKLAYAYTLNIRNAGVLQIGVNLGGMYKSLDGTNFRPPQTPNDPVLLNQVSQQFVPDLGAGLVYRGAGGLTSDIGEYYIGVGVNHLLEPRLDAFVQDNGQSDPSRVLRAYVLTGGLKWQATGTLWLEPNVIVRVTGPIVQVEPNLNARIEPVLFGISYRHQDAIAALLGLQLNDRIFAGYSYDYTISRLRAFSSGSHEIFVRITLPKLFKRTPSDLNDRLNEGLSPR